MKFQLNFKSYNHKLRNILKVSGCFRLWNWKFPMTFQGQFTKKWKTPQSYMQLYETIYSTAFGWLAQLHVSSHPVFIWILQWLAYSIMWSLTNIQQICLCVYVKPWPYYETLAPISKKLTVVRSSTKLPKFLLWSGTFWWSIEVSQMT